MKLVAEGLSNAQIAERLFLSEATVKQRLRIAYRLLGVKNSVQAAALYRQGGSTEGSKFSGFWAEFQGRRVYRLQQILGDNTLRFLA